MPSITLASYKIVLRRARETEPLQLGKFDGKDDFADAFRKYVEALRSSHANDAIGQHVQHTQAVSSKNDQVWGTIRSGEYGFTADIVDAGTLATRFQREPSDAQLLPFYFLFRGANSSKNAVILLQRFGVHGVFTSFMKGFHEWFRERYPDFTFDVKRLIPAKVIEHLLNGGLKSIEFQTFEAPDDITNKVKAFSNLGKTGRITIRVEAVKDGFLGRPDSTFPPSQVQSLCEIG
jgi:hypothetical protein